MYALIVYVGAADPYTASACSRPASCRRVVQRVLKGLGWSQSKLGETVSFISWEGLCSRKRDMEGLDGRKTPQVKGKTHAVICRFCKTSVLTDLAFIQVLPLPHFLAVQILSKTVKMTHHLV